jgi:solute carrier family 35 (adenosine 3'-phospho 5'-phosphosulfate transporter), member B2
MVPALENSERAQHIDCTGTPRNYLFSFFLNLSRCKERMLTRRYPRYHGEYFTYSYALVFSNRFWTLIMSGMLMLYLKPRRSRTTVIYEYSFPSISNMLSSWCQYEALRYVSFPSTTLFKSFKLAPVMAMGMILGNKSCTDEYCS